VNGLLGTIDSLAMLPLERAMERTGVGLAACDASGRLTLLSPVLQEMFGIPFAPVPEEDYAYVFHLLAEDCTTPLAYQDIPLVRARRGEFVRDALVIARRPDGRLAAARPGPVGHRAGRRRRARSPTLTLSRPAPAPARRPGPAAAPANRPAVARRARSGSGSGSAPPAR
jgi:PAS domain-containing protein